MPQVLIASAIASAFKAAGFYITSQALAMVAATVQFIAVTAASMAASKLLAPKMPSFSDSSLSERGQMVRSPIAARSIIYGRCRVSGTIVYISTTGTKNEYLHLVVALAGHEVEAIDEIYFNDEEVPLSGNQPTGFYSGVALINKKRGVPNDTADADLIAATVNLTDGKWTADHKLSGIAYLYVRLTWDAEKYPSGIPNISAVVRGRKVFDPRNSQTVYSANAALCLRDYLTNASLSMGMTTAEMDDTAFGVAANVCDENVEIKPVTVPATEENRYEANGVVSTSASPDENIGKLLSAMGGLIAYTGGKIAPYAAAYRIPTVTFTEKHFVGPISVQTRTSARDRVNSVKGVYLSEINNWQVTDFPTITDATYVSDDNGIVFFRDVVLPFTTSSSCAQRLAVIELRRAREEITMSARFRLEAMQVRAGDTVMITNSKLGFSSKVFEVMEWNFASGGNPPEVFVDMTLRETDSSVYSWNVTDEIYTAGALNTTLPNPFSISAPTNLSLTADGTTQFIQLDGSVMPRIRVAWTPPAVGFIESGGAVVIEYKPSTSTTYLTWSRLEGSQTEDFISSDVKIGTNYNVRIYGESYFRISTSYLSGTITVAKDTTAPSIPTGLTAVVGTGRAVSLDWNDNTEPDFSEYGIYRKTTAVTPANANTSKVAEVRASRFVDTDVDIGTTYYYWLNAYDSVENVSGFTNYVQATPSVITAGPIDPTPPDQPAAPTLISTTVYLSSDGGSFARVSLTAPPLPARAVALDVLYRRTGASDYIVGNQIASSVSYAVSIDDLTVGESYEFAARGISFSGAISQISTTLSQTAPSNTTAPTTPSDGAISSKAPAVLTWAVSSLYFGAHVSWSINSDKDFAYFEIKSTTTNTDAAVDFIWFPANGTAGLYQTREPFFDYYRADVQNGHVRIRAVNRSGTASAWHYAGNIASYTAVIGGDMSLQNKTAVNITGGTVTGITDITLADGGTGASTAANARVNLLPAYAGNGLKTLALNSGATDVEWSAAGTGTVTSVALSGGTTGLTVSGSPITTSGTITVAGTLAIANGGTGATTDSGARTALGLGTAATANLNALGAITVDKISFTGGDPVTTIDEDWGITLNGDATHPVRVVGAALAMGAFDQNVAMTAGRIYLAEDRALYTSGTDLLFNNGSVTISITAAPVVPVVTTVILGYPLCSTYGGTDGDYLRQISYNSVTYLCFGA